MTTKKIIGLAAVGLIFYELWKRERVQGTIVPEFVSPIRTNNMSPIPLWGQQLSATSGTTTETSILDDLMSIPQGPGGLPSPGAGVNFFATPECILPPIA